MKRDEARETLKGYLPDYMARALEPSKSGLYNCPFCGSGTGEHGTGALSLLPDGKAFYCHACGKRGDILDLVGELENITDYNGRLQRAAQLYGIEIDQPQPRAREVYQAPAATDQPADYSAFFLSAYKNINNTDYPAKRGLSRNVIDRFKIGYAAEWRHPKAPARVPATPRLIIPTSKESYLARDTRDNIPEEQRNFAKQKVGTIHFLNAGILGREQKPVYIVEGEIDALSIIEAGGEAIALGTAKKTKAFVKYAAEHKPAQPLIVALDNDKVGEASAAELMDLLAGQRIPAYRFNPCGEYKDANEALVKNREAFVLAVRTGERAQEKAEEDAKAAYLQTATSHYIAAFMDGVKESANTPAIPTGFIRLDLELDGGLYEGLYLIGAISSIGKTTFILQIADQIAQQGHDVLFFSLEMARAEIMAKSISRLTYQINMEDPNGKASLPKTTRGITAGAKYEHYSQEEKKLIRNAVIAYSQYAGNIYIKEGMGDIGAEDIRRGVIEHIRFTGKAPIVFIDYMQILAPYNDRATDKQNTDKAVLELKRISRDYKLPLIAVSSFNRASYNGSADMAAFKESGALEYSADVLLALQFWKDPAKEYMNPDEEKQKNPRKIELKILKNRNGKTGGTLPYYFDARFNVYEESEEDFISTSAGDGDAASFEEASEFLSKRRKRKKQS